MTQNRVSNLLLRYEVTGQEQLLKANVAATLSFKDAEKAAKELGISLEKLQELSNARIEATPIKGGLLGRLQDGRAEADGFLRDLEKIQAAEGKSVGTNEKITEELKKQNTYLQNRLKFTETDALAGLRGSIGAPVAGAAAAPGRTVSGTLNTVRDAAIALPGVGYQNPAVVALRGISTLADKTGTSFTQLIGSAGIVAPALIGVAVALNQLTEIAASGKRRLEAALTAQAAYYDAVATLSTADVQNRLVELRQRQAVEQQAAENSRGALEQNFQALQSRIGGNVTFVGDALARLFDNQVGLDVLREASQKAETQLNATTDEITRLEQGLQGDAFAANDAAEALEAHTEALRKSKEEFQSDLRASTNTEADLRGRLAGIRRNGSTQQIQDELASNSDREAILRNFLIPSIESLGLSAEETRKQTQDYRDELNRLLETDELLTNVVQPVVAAREAETEAIKSQLAVIDQSISYYAELSSQIRTSTVEQVSDRLQGIEEERRAIAEYLPELIKLAPTSKEAADALAEAQANLTSLSLEYNDQLTRVLPAAQARALAELNTDLDKLASESAAKLAQIEEQRLEKDADALEKRNDALTAAEEKRGDALNDLADKQAQQRVKIERKSNAEIANAVFARDAWAAYLALQKKQEDLQSLKEDGEARAKELDKQFEKDRTVANRNYERARRDAQQAADRAVRLERARQQAEYNERVTAYNAQLTLLRNFVTHANAELQNLRVPNLQNAITGGSGGATILGGGAAPVSPYGALPANPYYGQRATDAQGNERIWNGYQWALASQLNSYAVGIANVPNDQIARLHKGERVLTAAENRVFSSSSNRNTTINVNFDGKTIRASSRNEALKVLDEYLDDGGIS